MNTSSDVLELSKGQIEQSLMDRIRIFEEEVSWGIAPQELRGLTGRIGELYVAYATNGKLASRANQEGYDVVSDKGERISVKTRVNYTTDAFGISVKTFYLVDRVTCVRISVDKDEKINVKIELDVDNNTVKAAPIREVTKGRPTYRLALSKVNEPLQYDTQWNEVTLREL